MLKLCHGEKECHVMEQLCGDIASSRPMLTKDCCKGNNYEQRFALDTFPADFYWRNVLAKRCFCCLPCSRSAIRAKRVGCCCCKSCICCFPKFSRNCVPTSLVYCCLPGSRRYWQQHKPYHSIFRKNQKTMGDGTHSIPHQGVMTVLISSSSTLRRRIGRPPGPPRCGGTSTTDRPWNSRWRKPHPGRRCWRRPVREDRCKYLLSYPLR